MSIDITGAKILFTIPILGGLPITETIVVAWGIMFVISILCFALGRNLTVHGTSKRQQTAELLVEKSVNWVKDNMGEIYAKSAFPAFIGTLFAFAIICSLVSLIGLYPPTADLSTCIAWALIVFIMITYTKIRSNKLSGYLKGFTKPVPLLAPLNVITEIATPVSMAFRFFGNIASSMVINSLVYAALAVLNQVLFSWLPGAFGDILSIIPFAQVGLPAILSLYFDIFSSFMQSFIFCILTMIYIANAAEKE